MSSKVLSPYKSIPYRNVLLCILLENSSDLFSIKPEPPDPRSHQFSSHLNELQCVTPPYLTLYVSKGFVVDVSFMLISPLSQLAHWKMIV